MKMKIAVKLTVVGILIVAAAYVLRGHDTLTAFALLLLLLVVVAKVVFAIISHRRGSPPGGGGRGSSDRPVSRPPGGRPPALSEAQVKYESAA